MSCFLLSLQFSRRQPSKTKLGRNVAEVNTSHAVFCEAVTSETAGRVLRKFFNLVSKSLFFSKNAILVF